MSQTRMLQLLFKASTKAGAQNVANMGINLVIPSAMHHSHIYKTKNSGLFKEILDTSKFLIGKYLSTNVPNVGIMISFLGVISTVAIMDIVGVIAQT